MVVYSSLIALWQSNKRSFAVLVLSSLVLLLQFLGVLFEYVKLGSAGGYSRLIYGIHSCIAWVCAAHQIYPLLTSHSRCVYF